MVSCLDNGVHFTVQFFFGSSGFWVLGFIDKSCIIPRNSSFSKENEEWQISTSLLYHAFGAPDYQYICSEYKSGQVLFRAQPGNHPLRCPCCNSTNVIRRGQKQRRLRTLPIGKKPVFLELSLPRVECRTCGAIRQIHMPFADARRSYTHAFEQYVLDLSRMMTIKDVAQHLNVGWDMVKDIQKRHLTKKFTKPKLKHLRLLAVDEIAVSKGHCYLTVVMDLESGKVVFVGNGKGADALIPFFKRLRRAKAKIEAVAIDMSPAYIKAFKTNLKDAAIVFDHFHVVKLFNEKLSNFRRDLQRETTFGSSSEAESAAGDRLLYEGRTEPIMEPTR